MIAAGREHAPVPGLNATECTHPLWPLSVATPVRVASSHNRTVLSQLPVASMAPSGLNATDITPVSPGSVVAPRRNRPVSRHRCTGSLEFPLASVAPSGLNATEDAAPCGPARAAVQVWADTFHSRTRRPPLTSAPSGPVPWSHPLASVLPSGLNATECTRPLWPVSTVALDELAGRPRRVIVSGDGRGAGRGERTPRNCGPGRVSALS